MNSRHKSQMRRAAQALASRPHLFNENAVVSATVIDKTLYSQKADKALQKKIFEALWVCSPSTVYDLGEAHRLLMSPTDMATAVLLLSEVL
jgi:hypothetical protein